MVDALVLSELYTYIYQWTSADIEHSAFFIPFGQVVSDAIGAGVQNMHNGWRLLCK